MTSAAISFDALAAAIEWPDAEAAATARSRARPGSGRLAELREWLAATRGADPPPPLHCPRLVLIGGSSDPLAGLAEAAGVGIGTVDLTGGSALHAGIATADDEIDAGADLLVVATSGKTGAAPALPVVVSLLTSTEPTALLPRGAHAVDTEAWIARAELVRDTRREVAGLRRDPAELLVRLGDDTLAAATGMILQAVGRRTPLILDGVAAVVAGLIVADLASRAARWWQVADTLADPVHTRAATECDRTPLLQLDVLSESGIAGLLAVHLLRAAVSVERTES